MYNKGMGCYIAIDLKSFYASVECVERGLDPLSVNLVVADKSRTEKTICLAVSPSLKAYGISGRARLFEVVRRVSDINESRRRAAPGRVLSGESFYDAELKQNPSLALGYIVAPPRMARYIEYSTDIYKIYLRFVAPEDIHVYSIDEVFIDASGYLNRGKITPRDFAMKIIREVLRETGITATAGIGTNLYLAKIAMDITAKHMPADSDGVRIAELDEMSYRRQLWSHRPITDFWRVGAGYAKKLEQNGLYTMGDIARCSLGGRYDIKNEQLLYKLFGINAELLIDHAWGWEPCTIADIKAYKPETNSLSHGQVLHRPYSAAEARRIVREMSEMLVLELVDKALVTDRITLTVGYDAENLANGKKGYAGEVTSDRYGRSIPKHSHGVRNLEFPTSSTRAVTGASLELYDSIINNDLTVRRLTLTAEHAVDENSARVAARQIDLFSDGAEAEKRYQSEQNTRKRERSVQRAMLGIKKRYGKNAILKAADLEEGATAAERNNQIGGHKA